MDGKTDLHSNRFPAEETSCQHEVATDEMRIKHGTGNCQLLFELPRENLRNGNTNPALINTNDCKRRRRRL